MMYESDRGRVLLFGGSDNPPLNDTWEFMR